MGKSIQERAKERLAAKSLATQQHGYADSNRRAAADRAAKEREDKAWRAAPRVKLPISSRAEGDLEDDSFDTRDFTSGNRFGDDSDPFGAAQAHWPSPDTPEGREKYFDKTPLGTTRRMSSRELGQQLSMWLADKRGRAVLSDALAYAASSAGLDPSKYRGSAWGRPVAEKLAKDAPAGSQSLPYTPVPEE